MGWGLGPGDPLQVAPGGSIPLHSTVGRPVERLGALINLTTGKAEGQHPQFLIVTAPHLGRQKLVGFVSQIRLCAAMIIMPLNGILFD
jgi:hypothetical protein